MSLCEECRRRVAMKPREPEYEVIHDTQGLDVILEEEPGSGFSDYRLTIGDCEHFVDEDDVERIVDLLSHALRKIR